MEYTIEYQIEKLTKEEVEKLRFPRSGKYDKIANAVNELLIGEGLRIAVPVGTVPSNFRQAVSVMVKQRCKDTSCKVNLLGNVVIINRIL